MTGWGIATLADEPGALIAAFVAHHLDLGAAEVHVLLDRPNDEARDLLSGVRGAVLSDAGADAWAFRGMTRRPVRHLGRQKYHASRVLAESRLGWVLHCDVDEFVVPVAGQVGVGQGGAPDPVGAVLATLPDSADWLHIGVAERVWAEGDASGLFDGPFRLPFPDFQREGRKVYDATAMDLLHRGVCGHHLGKAVARAGRGHFLGIHQPMRDYEGGGRDLHRAETDRLLLLHFDGLTPLHYALKMVRRALAAQVKSPPPHAPHRQLQFEALAGAGADAAAIMEQWRAAKTIDAAQRQALTTRGLLATPDPQIPARMRRLLPAMPDLSPAAFDDALIAREADLIARAQAAFAFDPAPLRTH